VEAEMAQALKQEKSRRSSVYDAKKSGLGRSHFDDDDV